MSDRRRAADLERPTHEIPADALTPEERARFDKPSGVDADAAIAWLNGEGPDPWQRDESPS